jgi:hypothetical protein
MANLTHIPFFNPLALAVRLHCLPNDRRGDPVLQIRQVSALNITVLMELFFGVFLLIIRCTNVLTESRRKGEQTKRTRVRGACSDVISYRVRKCEE